MSRLDLERIRKWAIGKISGGQQRQVRVGIYAELRQAVDGILSELDALKEETSSREPPGKKAEHLQLVWSKQSRPETP
jgi:hypothetical protein